MRDTPFRAAVIASPVPEPAALPSAPSLADAAALGSSPDALPAAMLSSRRGSHAADLVLPFLDGRPSGGAWAACIPGTAFCPCWEAVPRVAARMPCLVCCSGRRLRVEGSLAVRLEILVKHHVCSVQSCCQVEPCRLIPATKLMWHVLGYVIDE